MAEKLTKRNRTISHLLLIKHVWKQLIHGTTKCIHDSFTTDRITLHTGTERTTSRALDVYLWAISSIMVLIFIVYFKPGFSYLHTGYFFMFFVVCRYFTTFFFKITSECQPTLLQIRPCILLGLTWVQTICKGHQQTASWNRVNDVPGVYSFIFLMPCFYEHSLFLWGCAFA